MSKISRMSHIPDHGLGVVCPGSKVNPSPNPVPVVKYPYSLRWPQLSDTAPGFSHLVCKVTPLPKPYTWWHRSTDPRLKLFQTLYLWLQVHSLHGDPLPDTIPGVTYPCLQGEDLGLHIQRFLCNPHPVPYIGSHVHSLQSDAPFLSLHLGSRVHSWQGAPYHQTMHLESHVNSLQGETSP